MKNKWFVLAFMIVATIAFCSIIGMLQYQTTPKFERRIDHIEHQVKDSSLGISEIPEDGMVDDNFVSHLPLLVLDTNGEEIVNYKEYNKETDAFEVPEGIDPSVTMNLSVYDRDQAGNTLHDAPTLTSQGTIKVRGNSSAATGLPKLQYRMKLLDENGEKNKLDLLGMGEDDNWILNPTVRDQSYIRNYLAFNIAGQVEPFQPDVRYCEVLMKEQEGYRYMGLYMLYEPVDVSSNRINISKDASKYNIGNGYLLKKDRFDQNAMVLDTWATRQGYYQYGDAKLNQASYFMLEYPSHLESEKIAFIEEELSYIEQLLYYDELRNYRQLKQYLDIDSFVDYFILNEFFGNYDAGNNSTYMYKNVNGKLTMGPYWDFDGAMDNAKVEMTDPYTFAFPDQPWFNCLLKTEEFVKKVENRYHELRKNILNESDLYDLIDGAQNYLGNALLRDHSAYPYTYDLQIKKESKTGIEIDRRRYSIMDETQRVKDFLHEHGTYMDQNIYHLYEYVDHSYQKDSFQMLLAGGFILSFLVAIVLVQRYRYLK